MNSLGSEVGILIVWLMVALFFFLHIKIVSDIIHIRKCPNQGSSLFFVLIEFKVKDVKVILDVVFLSYRVQHGGRRLPDSDGQIYCIPAGN